MNPLRSKVYLLNQTFLSTTSRCEDIALVLSKREELIPQYIDEWEETWILKVVLVEVITPTQVDIHKYVSQQPNMHVLYDDHCPIFHSL